ncbi:hypothetical protein GCM10007423_16020 [Dyadobacter endophyticus]|uniref:Uncharacterized protein n=1 Tax=Dyadobacter endophyticus TaxID=1749036 RepID=A0ABQ1YJZ9_9BACT|nr:hypothetical protein [Dyadobacter endophyticus]GGH29018.1 hypothetical protein GCM10007423_16020 [Dyadobacter endophyticus]
MKNKKFPAGTSVHFLYFLVLAAVLSGCIESAPVPDEVKSSAPGFGSSIRRPEGTPVSFPPGIKVVDSPHWDEHCADQSGKLVYGVGDVGFCIQFSNSFDTPVTVKIPAGAIFISDNTESPNGFIIKDLITTIPAKSSQVLHLMTCSINQDRRARTTSFEAQPVLTNHYNIPELLSMLESKKINAADYDGGMPPAAISAIVQSAVYEVAHTGQLSFGSREKLLQLPDK